MADTNNPVWEDFSERRIVEGSAIHEIGVLYASLCPDSENCMIGYVCLKKGSCPYVKESSLEELIN
jgi:hypothetical protein